MTEEDKKKLSEEEMQELQDRIVAGVESYFETYDWDKAFLKYQEKKQKPNSAEG
jgi:hypothetical protein